MAASISGIELGAASGREVLPADSINSIAVSIPDGAELHATFGTPTAPSVRLNDFPVLRSCEAFGYLALEWSGVTDTPIRVLYGRDVDAGVTV